MSISRSMLGVWDYTGHTGICLPDDGQQHPYADDVTMRLGMAWLDETCETVEDWGCGTAWAARFLTRAAYTGVDGSPSPWTAVVADLREYQSDVDGIFMRGVIEHNEDWELVLANAVASFRRRLVLVVHTPVQDDSGQTRNIAAAGLIRPSSTPQALAHPGVPDLSFRRADLTRHLAGCQWREELVPSAAQYGPETMFYAEKPGAGDHHLP